MRYFVSRKSTQLHRIGKDVICSASVVESTGFKSQCWISALGMQSDVGAKRLSVYSVHHSLKKKKNKIRSCD